jgi:hypothetical protein
MTANLTITNLSQVISQMTKEMNSIEKAAFYALSRVALAVERQAKMNFQGKHRIDGMTKGGYPRWKPPGHIGGSFPNVRSGNLRSSIRTTMKGFGAWTAEVGPGMEYAHYVESRYPYMHPAAKKVRPQANRIFTEAFLKRVK